MRMFESTQQQLKLLLSLIKDDWTVFGEALKSRFDSAYLNGYSAAMQELQEKKK